MFMAPSELCPHSNRLKRNHIMHFKGFIISQVALPLLNEVQSQLIQSHPGIAATRLP